MPRPQPNHHGRVGPPNRSWLVLSRGWRTEDEPETEEVFRGKSSIRPTISTGVDEFPRYVWVPHRQLLLEETFHEDMEKVVRRLKETFVYGARPKRSHYIRENRSHSVIASLEATG